MTTDEINFWTLIVELIVGTIPVILVAVISLFATYSVAKSSTKAKISESYRELLIDAALQLTSYHSVLINYLYLSEYNALYREQNYEPKDWKPYKGNLAKAGELSESLFNDYNKNFNIASTKLLILGGIKSHELVGQYDH